jgi:DNA-binding NtrC family response regulator
MATPRAILYVEDDVDLRESVVLALEEEGYIVEGRSTAEDGLEALAGRAYDVLLTDFRLPHANGDWLLRQAAERGYLDRMSAIVLTGERDPQGIGGFPLLRKPIDLETLLCAIRAVTDSREHPVVTSHRPDLPDLIVVLYVARGESLSPEEMAKLQTTLAGLQKRSVKLQVLDGSPPSMAPRSPAGT